MNNIIEYTKSYAKIDYDLSRSGNAKLRKARNREALAIQISRNEIYDKYAEGLISKSRMLNELEALRKAANSEINKLDGYRAQLKLKDARDKAEKDLNSSRKVLSTIGITSGSGLVSGLTSRAVARKVAEKIAIKKGFIPGTIEFENYVDQIGLKAGLIGGTIGSGLGLGGTLLYNRNRK